MVHIIGEQDRIKNAVKKRLQQELPELPRPAIINHIFDMVELLSNQDKINPVDVLRALTDVYQATVRWPCFSSISTLTAKEQKLKGCYNCAAAGECTSKTLKETKIDGSNT